MNVVYIDNIYYIRLSRQIHPSKNPSAFTRPQLKFYVCRNRGESTFILVPNSWKGFFSLISRSQVRIATNRLEGRSFSGKKYIPASISMKGFYGILFR